MPDVYDNLLSNDMCLNTVEMSGLYTIHEGNRVSVPDVKCEAKLEEKQNASISFILHSVTSPALMIAKSPLRKEEALVCKAKT